MDPRAAKRVEITCHHIFPSNLTSSGGFGVTSAGVAGKEDSSKIHCPICQLSVSSLEKIQRGWLSQPQEFEYEITEVIGQIPSELKGTLYRNGPGLLEVYGTPLAHPIDGDGMVLAINFREGKAKFRSSYVKTSGYTVEKQAGKLVLRGLMGTKPTQTWSESALSWLSWQAPRFKNPSNTNVYFWGGKLLAVWESGLPYCLDPVTLETMGKDTLNGVLDEAKCLAAHFRYDSINDRLVTISLRINIKKGGSRVYFYEFNRQWELLSQSKYDLPQYYYCHDFLITENHYIVHHSPFYKIDSLNSTKILSGMSSPGQEVHFYPDVPSQFIVIPRNKNVIHTAPITDGIKSFKTEPCHIYHHINSHQEGEKIYFSSICLPENFNMEYDHKLALSNASVAPGTVYDYVIDLSQNTITRTKADPCSCEFPSSHPNLMGLPWRFGYLMAADGGYPAIPYQEVVKYDRLHSQRKVWSARDHGGIVGEPIFIPRNPAATHPLKEGEEDDGWVITQVYDSPNHKTHFVILDAKEMVEVARLVLRHHTPYGFHGTWNQL